MIRMTDDDDDDYRGQINYYDFFYIQLIKPLRMFFLIEFMWPSNIYIKIIIIILLFCGLLSVHHKPILDFSDCLYLII